MMEMFWTLSAILMVLNVLDAITTHNVIKSGAGMKANPIMAWSMKVFGSAWWISKIVIMAVVLWLFSLESESIMIIAAMVLLNAVYVYIVYKNYKNWRKGK